MGFLSDLIGGAGGWLKGMDWGGLAKTALPYALKMFGGGLGRKETPDPYFMTPPVNQALLDLYSKYLPEGGLPTFPTPEIPMGDMEALAYGMEPTTTPEAMTEAIERAYSPEMAREIADISVEAMGPRAVGYGRAPHVVAQDVSRLWGAPRASALAGVPGAFEQMASGRAGIQAGMLSDILGGRKTEAELGQRAAFAPYMYGMPGISNLLSGMSGAFGSPQMVQPGERAKYPFLSSLITGLGGEGGFDWGKIFNQKKPSTNTYSV